MSYLEQVEADARILLTRYKDSAYVQMLMAETFAEQRAFIQADEVYKKVLALPKFPSGVHAGYGFVLLNRHDLPGAERELRAELAVNPGSLMAKLAMARLRVEQGTAGQAAMEIGEIWKADAGFLRANISLFNSGLARPKRTELQNALNDLQTTDGIPQEVVALFRDSDVNLWQEVKKEFSPSRAGKTSTANPANLYASGSYGECSDVLGARVQHLSAKDLMLLASCAYLTGDYSNSLKAADRLASSPLNEVEGLYWETNSAQELATQSFARASAMDSDSPKLHVLLGDIYRQLKNFPEAEQEYRKALALRPEDTGAQFGLSLSMLAAGQNDEAMSLAHAVLQKNPDDPEFNAVIGEILCARNDFAAAEPYLKKSLNTKPEFVSRVHALLGKVYAQTGRIHQAIAELNLALVGDKDGTVHYQIARLYLKVGDRDSAREAFAVSERLRHQGLVRAAVALQQGANDSE